MLRTQSQTTAASRFIIMYWRRSSRPNRVAIACFTKLQGQTLLSSAEAVQKGSICPYQNSADTAIGAAK